MCVSLWEQAQGKTVFRNEIKRCDRCGRRVNFGDYVELFRGIEEETKLIIDKVCYQHGGVHFNCVTGQEIDFGETYGWGRIFVNNAVSEAGFWIRTTVRFVRSCVRLGVQIVFHPRRYYVYRKQAKELMEELRLKQ